MIDVSELRGQEPAPERRKPGRPKGSPPMGGRKRHDLNPDGTPYIRKGDRRGKRRPHTDELTANYWRRKLAAEGLGGDAPPVPDAEDVPASLRGGGRKPDRPPGGRRPPSAKAIADELRGQIAQLLAVANSAYLAVAPCTCLQGVPPELRGAVHLDNCAQMWALSEPEIASLGEAIAAELEAHPGIGDKVMAKFGEWAPHIALIMALFGIVSSRAGRKGEPVAIVNLSADQVRVYNAWRYPPSEGDGRAGGVAPRVTVERPAEYGDEPPPGGDVLDLAGTGIAHP